MYETLVSTISTRGSGKGAGRGEAHNRCERGTSEKGGKRRRGEEVMRRGGGVGEKSGRKMGKGRGMIFRERKSFKVDGEGDTKTEFAMKRLAVRRNKLRP